MKYRLYQMVLFTQQANLQISVVVDTEGATFRKHGCLVEQFSQAWKNPKPQPIRYEEVTGSAGIINPSAVAFINAADMEPGDAEAFRGKVKETLDRNIGSIGKGKA